MHQHAESPSASLDASRRSKLPLGHSLRIMARDPGLVSQLLRIGLYRYLLRPLDYARADLCARPPHQISIKITNRCNMRCLMCAQWGESGYHLEGEHHIPVQEEVPVDCYRELIRDTAAYRPYFYIWGGEPLLYRGLYEMLEELTRHDLSSSIVTNATLLDRHVEEIVESGLTVLFFSIDGPPEVNDRIRNMEGGYDKVWSSLERLRQVKEARGKKRPYVVMFFTICRDNVDQIAETFRLADEHGVDFLMGFYSWFTTEAIGAEHARQMRQRLDCEASAWRGYVFDYNQIDARKVQEQVEQVRASSYSYPYIFLPNLEPEQIPRYYADPTERFGFDRCYYPWLVTELQPNGDVAVCRDFPDYLIGNIQQQSLLELWNNDRYVQFRREIKRGLFPICSRCCGLLGL